MIAAEQGNVEAYDWLPVGKIQGKVVEMLRADSNFVETTVAPVLNSDSLIIFSRSTPFEGFTPTLGMAGVEGPYPQWNLPVVRWGLYPRTVLDVNFKGGGKAVLKVSGETNLPSETMTVNLNGKDVYTYTFKSVSKFEDMEVPIELANGKNTIQFNYTAGDPNPAKSMAVLFQKLTITSSK